MKGLRGTFAAATVILVAMNMLPASGPNLTGTRKTVFGATALGASGDNPCWNYKRAERSFARKMNGARANYGLGRMKIDPEASRAARKHTYEMANKSVLEHTTSTALRRRVTNWALLGENVGVGGTVSSLHSAFMNSPAHRANILLGSFQNVGVGTIKKGGRLWVTVIFESRNNPGTTLRMPSC